MDRYLEGTDAIVGASLSSTSQPQPQEGPFLTIHVKNVPELVAKQGGAAGAFAQRLVPQTIENKVYSEMASKMGAAMKAEGVNADIKIMSSRPAVGGAPQDFTVGALTGAAGVGVAYGLIKLVQHFIGRK